MLRRRRPSKREVAFSFDSFLDLVANVIGIIIRLILVAWVGARTYQSAMEGAAHDEPPAKVAKGKEKPIPADPLQSELERTKHELELARAELLDKLKQMGQVEEKKDQVSRELAGVAATKEEIDRQRQALDQALAAKGKTIPAANFTLAELRERSQSVLKQIQALEKMPIPKKTLRYRTPVSRPVHTDELMFECRHGRVTFIDLPAFMAEVRRGLEDKVAQLRTQWEITDVAGPIGAFRLRYVVERHRDLLDTIAPNGMPAGSGFRYGMSEWVLEPVSASRGEPVEKALAPGSEFRHIVDSGLPQVTVATFWVYPDSFALFRQLRDYLYERGLEVAGRPLPDEFPISASKTGTKSRGQ